VIGRSVDTCLFVVRKSETFTNARVTLASAREESIGLQSTSRGGVRRADSVPVLGGREASAGLEVWCSSPLRSTRITALWHTMT
jgi:hypothetical protein